jgi:hypothetical protein
MYYYSLNALFITLFTFFLNAQAVKVLTTGTKHAIKRFGVVGSDKTVW